MMGIRSRAPQDALLLTACALVAFVDVGAAAAATAPSGILAIAASAAPTIAVSAAPTIAASAAPTFAAPTEESPAALDPIVLVAVATRLERPLDEVVGTVDVIDAADLEARVVRDAADLARYLPGVSVEGTGTRFGDLGFTIRGVGGDRVKVEVDGVPRNDAFAVGAFANATRDFLDPELVRRIEILRGPASTLYGSDALGGVVAISTKDPRDLLGGGGSDGAGPGFDGALRLLHSSIDGSDAISGVAAAGTAERGIVLGVTTAQGHEPDHSAEATVPDDPQDWNRRSLLAKGVWHTDDGDQFTLVWSADDESVQTDVRSLLGRGRFNTTTELTGDDLQTRDSLVAQWLFRGRFGLERGVVRAWDQDTVFDQRTVQVRMGATPRTREERRFLYQQDGNGVSGDFEARFEAFGAPQRLGIGVLAQRIETRERRDGLRYNLSNGTVGNVILGETFPVRDFPLSTTDTIGAWVQDEFVVAERLTVLPGVRFDYSHLDPDPDPIYLADNPSTTPTPLTEQAVSPKLGLQWAASDALDLFVQYAHGFRAPPFEDVNIGLDIALFGYVAIPNPDLESERSEGLELGLRWLAPRNGAELVLYRTDFEDLIESRVNLGVDPISGKTIFQSQNRDAARIQGVEARGHHEWRSATAGAFVLHGALAWSEGEDSNTGAPLNSIDPAELVLGVEWRAPSQRWSVELIGTAVDGKDEVEDPPGVTLFQAPGYGVLDLYLNLTPDGFGSGCRSGGSRDCEPRVVVTLGVQNLTDRAYWRWSSVQGFAATDPVVDLLSAPGRSVTASLRFPF
jgi:hemoglobin/transferrin/lactoferrin receptor protein